MIPEINDNSTQSFNVSSKVKLVRSTEIDKTIAEAAIAKINASVNWSHYNGSVNRYLDQNKIIFVMKDNDIIGYVTFRSHYRTKNPEKNTPSPMYIPYIAVDSKHQGTGAALKLMKEVINIAKSENRKKVVLDYRGNKEKTRRFYEIFAKREGFDTKDKLKGSYGDDPKVKKTFYIN